MSVNAIETTETPISRWFDTVFMPIVDGMKYLNSLYPDSKANNEGQRGINPQDSTKTRVSE